MDADFVQSVYTAYRSLGEADFPEPEFKLCACQNLFIGEYVLLANDARRQLCAVRSVEWSLKPCRSPQQCEWLAPPLSPNQSPLKPFGFDIYSDCQFWLCDKVLTTDYRTKARLVVHRKRKGTFCPYFTIEFKATTDDTRTLVNQVAAAGLISLFNRYRLKLDAHSPRAPPEQLEDVRHYGLTMEQENWMVWLFEPKIVSGVWAGCKIRAIDGGACDSIEGVCGLLSWINEIHRWGLCEYALGCEEDIKQVLSKAPINMKVSTIGS